MRKLSPSSILAVTLFLFWFLILLPKESHAAITRENSSPCSNNGATTISCTIAAPTDGNTLIAVIGTRGTTTGTVTSFTHTGATWVRAHEVANANGVTTEIWYAENVSGAGTAVTINLADLKASAIIAEYSGLLTSSSLDVVSQSTGNSSSPDTGTTATTERTVELWVGGMANINTDTYSLQTNDFLEVEESASTGGPTSSRNNAVFEEKIVSATGTANVGATLSGTQQWAGVIVTFKGVLPASQVAFTNANRTITAGLCSGASNSFTVEMQNEVGAPTAPSGSTVIRVTTSSGGTFTVYSDSSCNTTVTNGDFTFTTSDTAKTFYIKDTRKSNPTHTLTAAEQSGPDTIASGIQTYTVNADAVSRLVITLPSQTFTDGTGNSGSVDNQTAGSSFTITKISATDDFFNVNPTYSGAKTLVYSGPANAPDTTTPAYTTAVSFTTGQSTTTLTTTLYKAETTTITATDGGSFGHASSSVTVNPGSLNNYEVTVATPQTAGVCFTGTNTVKARDQWLNYRTTDTSVVNMTSSGTSVTFYTSGTCGTSTTQYTLSSGTANIFVRTNKKQSFTVTATRDAGTETGTSGSITVDPAAASTILVRLPGQTFTDGTGISGSSNFSGLRTPNATAGTSFDVDLKAVDAFNNLVDSGPNNFTGDKTLSWTNSTAGDSPSGQGPSFPGNPVSFSNGSANSKTLTYYNAATLRTVRADQVSGISGTASTTFTVQAAAANNYAVAATTPQTAGSAFNVTVTARDQWNNSLGSLYSAPSGTYTWSTNAGNAPDTTPPSIGTLVQGDFSSGVATKSVTLYKAESGVTFTANEPPSSSVGGTSSAITVNPNVINNYEVVVVTPQTAGVCFTGTNTVKARDQWLNYRTTDTTVVDMTTSGTGVTFYTSGTCGTSTTQYTLSSGTANIFIRTNTKQSMTVTATKTADTETGTSGTIVVDPAAVSRLVITLPSQTFTDGTGNSGSVDARTAGSSFTITKISATDDFFNVNPTYSGAKTLVYSGPVNAPDTTAPTYTTAVSFTTGQSTTTLTTTLYKAETTTITATDGGSYGYASASLTVNAGAVSSDAADSTVTGPTTKVVNTDATITITLKDTWQNPKSGVAGTDITFTGTTATFAVQSGPSDTNSSGISTADLRWSDFASKTVIVNVTGATPSTQLSDTHVLTITAEVPPEHTILRGGTEIRGGTRIGQ